MGVEIVWCGIEEPMVSNSYLYSINEDTGAVGFSNFELPELNRYSFTCLQHGDRPLIIETLLNTELCRWCIVASYELSSGFKIRNMAGASRLEKQGYDLYIDEELMFATKEYMGCSDCALEPVGFTTHHAAWAKSIVLFGRHGNAMIEWKSKTKDLTIRQMASQGGRISPSKQFLQFLSTDKLTMVYESQNIYDKFGLVIISPMQLEISRLIDTGLITRIEFGDDAQQVWT